MKPTLLVSLLLAVSALHAGAQDFSVVQSGKRTVFQPDANQLAVIATEDGAIIARPDFQETQVRLPNRWAQIRRPSSAPASARTRMTEQLRHPKVAFTAPVLRTPEGDEVVPTPSILLKLKTTQDVAAFLRARGINSISSIKKLTSDGIHEITTNLRDGAAVMDLAATLAARSEVKLAVPNFLRKARMTLEATDPDFAAGMSWGLRAMKGPQAWDVTTGRSSVVVAVFDGGIQQDHPEINQVPGVSTSGLQGSNGDTTPAPALGHDHGVMVASCISGRIDNAIGSCGIAPNVRCISVRWCTPVLFPGQEKPVLLGLDSDIVTGLRLAAEAGARISVHSYSFAWVSQAMEETFASTREQGMIHFASAGNDADDIEGFESKPFIHYPASSPFVLCVGAASNSTTRAVFSQFGAVTLRDAKGVDFMAPGQGVAVMGRTGMPGKSDTRAVEVNGTSFAAPYAAGVAALMLSVKSSLTPQQVEDLMISGCRDMGDVGWDRRTGFGLVNAFASLPDDHGDTSATATSVASTSVTAGHLNRATDCDQFKFTITEFCRLKIHTSGQVIPDVQILFASSGMNAEYDARIPSTSACPGWTSGNFRTDIAMSPGNYVARVIGRNSSMGVYQLHLTQGAAFPEITVLGNNTLILDGDTTPDSGDHTAFGTTRPGVGVTRTFTIRNDGQNILHIRNTGDIDGNRVPLVQVTPVTTPAGGVRDIPVPQPTPVPAPVHFRVTTNPATQILPGRSSTFKVTFKPVGTGFFRHTLRIESDDQDEPSFDFVINGSSLFTPTSVGLPR